MASKTDSRATRRGTRPKLIIDSVYYERLVGLAQIAAENIPDIGERLLEEIERAEIVPSEAMPADVVTIGSQVTYSDSATGRTQTVQLVLPRQADLQAGRLSLLTPVGAALIGLTKGQAIDWEMADGSTREIKVIDVAAGDAGDD